MAFVKDDHGYTRGPGAIAAMDATSPARRLAAARAERALRVREALTQGAIETGQEAAFSRPPPRPARPRPGKLPIHRLPFRPKDIAGGKLSVPVRPGMVKLPGSVITPPKAGEVTPTQTATPTSAPISAPTKAPVTIVAGGSGTSWVSGAAAKTPAAPVDNQPPPWAPEPEPEQAVATAPAAPAKKPSSKILLYAALGIGAWWLLTRKK